MAGKVIGKTLPFGYRGNPSRNPDTIIEPFVNKGTDNIQYGDPVLFDPATKGVRRLKSTDSTASMIIGIAVRRVGQPYANNMEGYYYAPGDMVDVLTRGSIMVELGAHTGLAARGTVYADPATGEISTLANHTPEGGSQVNHLAIPNAIFATGNYDGNEITEITILSRSV